MHEGRIAAHAAMEGAGLIWYLQKRSSNPGATTALHMAVAERNQTAMQLLLQAGADPQLRTRIDECETAREMAERAGFSEIAKMLG